MFTFNGTDDVVSYYTGRFIITAVRTSNPIFIEKYCKSQIKKKYLHPGGLI
jgi:hypothetical protein